MATLLIVDDDKHTRALLETVVKEAPRLRRYDLTTVVAGDGEEGLEVFAAAKPTVVVTDLLMPKMDGFRFCQALRATPEGRRVALFIISGVYRDVSVSKRVRDEFGATLFAKPYQIADLVNALEKVLASSEPRPELVAAPAPAEAPVVTFSVAPPVAPDAVAPMRSPQQGELATTPLPGLLLELYEERATGELEIRRGRIEKKLDLVIGHPVAVTSNQRSETLGHYLVARNVITEAQHGQALERAREEGEKLGEALVELGFLSHADVVRQLALQMRHKITGALRWPDGTYAFRPDSGLADRAKGSALDPVGAVFSGLRKTGDAEDAARTVARVAGRRLGLTARGERLAAAIDRYFGEGITSSLATRPTIEELFGTHREPGALLPIVEALLLTGCAEAAGPMTVTPRRTHDPLALTQLSTAALVAEPPHSAPAGGSAQTRESNLYDQLFGDEMSAVESLPTEAPPDDGVPTELLDVGDSAVIDVPDFDAPISIPSEHETAAREGILGEYLRVQGKDWYSVLEVARDAPPVAVEQAYAARCEAFALDRYAVYDLGRDYAKLEAVHAAYRQARDVLTAPDLRDVYDRQLAKSGGAPPSQAALDAEIDFREAERLLGEGEVEASIEGFRRAVARFPDMADYHAGLGWALAARHADDVEAIAHLQQALVIDPDHAAAHEYVGRIAATARTAAADEEALRHLERALDARPARLGALDALVEIRTRNGAWEGLEKQYRKLIHALGLTDRAASLRLWLALGDIYRQRLENRDAARTSYTCALRLSPNNPAILRALSELTAGDTTRFDERAETLRAQWRLSLDDATPGRELFRTSLDAGRHDHAFVVAGLLAARGLADEAAESYYRRYRPRFLVRASGALDGEVLGLLRHAEDDAALGRLFALLEPVGVALMPMTLADLGVVDADLVAEAALPTAFRAVRDYVAGVLGVATPRVARSADFGGEVHVGAVDPPVLLAGPEALASSDRLALGFRLARAMSYLAPGRLVGGSRPSRALKQLFYAAMSLAVPAVPVDDPDGTVAAARDLLAARSPAEVAAIKAAVSPVIEGAQSVNLSRWVRALARTGDRIGLLLCGDPPTALRGAADVGSAETTADLIDHALSPAHLRARARVGVSVDV